MGKRLAIVGAGPMGLEAALLGRAHGFEVTVLEASVVGEGVTRWGPTRCFSPFSMNTSPRLRAALGTAAPADDALLLGPEIAERVLRPIARSLGSQLRERTRVISIGRARMSRGELAGHPVRADRPFRLLVESEAGEDLLEADRVLDASGVYGQPVPFGAGPLAIGERGLDRDGLVLRQLGALHEALARGTPGRRFLLIGHGHSAAHAIGAFAALPVGTQVIWAVRSPNARPVTEVAADPLPERARVAALANDLAESPPPWLTVERRASVERVARIAAGVEVSLSGDRRRVVDTIVSFTGYRPDRSIFDELAVEISPVSEGADRLQRAIGNVSDCLHVPAVRAEDLASGEPGFHLIGSKSYGRARTFLLGTGIAQLEALFGGL